MDQAPFGRDGVAAGGVRIVKGGCVGDRAGFDVVAKFFFQYFRQGDVIGLEQGIALQNVLELSYVSGPFLARQEPDFQGG